MAPFLSRPARDLWSWWMLFTVSIVLLSLLLGLNLYGWRRTRNLRIDLAQREAYSESLQLARRACEHVNARLQDLQSLGFSTLHDPPDRREAQFMRDARGLINREPSFRYVALMHSDGLVAARVVAEGSPLKTDSGETLSLPEIAGAVTVFTTLQPWCSAPFALSSGEIVLASAVPLPATDDDATCKSAAVGIIGLRFVADHVRGAFLDEYFGMSIQYNDTPLFSTAAWDAHEDYLSRSVEVTQNDALGGVWKVTTWLHTGHSLSELESDSVFRLSVNLFYSFLLWILLVYMLFSIRRLRLGRRALRLSQERYALAISAGKVGVWDCRPDTNQLFAPDLARILGFEEEEIGSDLKDWLKLVPKDDQINVLSRAQAHIKGLTPRYECEHRMLRKDGRTVWLVCAGSIVDRVNGRPVRMVGTSTDITERRMTEDALRWSEERYALAAQAGRSGVWEYALETDILSTDRNLKTLFGYTENELPDGTDIWRRMVHPDDHNRLRQLINEHIEGKSDRFSCEHRIVDKDGRIHWVSSSGSAVRDASGSAVRVVGAATDITERRAAEEALRKSEVRYVMATRAGRVGVWDYNIPTNTIETDDNMKTLFGYMPEEIEDDTGVWSQMITPADLERLLKDMWSHIEGKTPRFECEGLVRCKDGTLRWALASGYVVRNDLGNPIRVIGTATDVTERKQADEARRRESERAQRYLDIAGVIILALDLEQCITLINRKGCEVMGYAESEMLGKNWISLCLPERLQHAFREVFERIIHGQTDPAEYIENPVVTKTGEERLIAWHNIPMHDDSGKAIGLLSSGEDVTDRRRAQEEARQREQQMIQTDKMASLGILVSGVAHEINNPNSFILTNIGVLHAAWNSVRPILDRYYGEHGDFLVAGLRFSRMRDRVPVLLSGISDGARRIKTTVEELRGFSQQEPPGLIEEVNLNDVVRAASTLLGNMIRKATRSFVIMTADDLPPVRGSFRRLEQVVINLIQNACQALTSREQGIHITTALDTGTLHITLTVRDEGSGIQDDVMPRIMDPFFTTKRDSGGTGLGLSISEKIIRDHGGTLSFVSELGHGTTATVVLPLFFEVASAEEAQL